MKRVSKQIDKNKAQGKKAVIILFVWERNLFTTKTDLYFDFRLKKKTETENIDAEIDFTPEIKAKEKQRADFLH